MSGSPPYRQLIEEVGRFTVAGLQTRLKRYDAATGAVLARGDSFEDLADCLPALIAYGDIEAARRVIDAAVASIDAGESAYATPGRGARSLFRRAYDQSDLIFGLLLAVRLDRAYLSIAGCALDTWCASFLSPPRMAVLDRLPGLPVRMPKSGGPGVHILSASDHGMFIELLAMHAELTGDAQYSERAAALLERFLATSTYRRLRFFPFYEATGALGAVLMRNMRAFAKRKDEFQLLKENSNILFGVLRLCRPSHGCTERTRKVLDESVEAWRTWALGSPDGPLLTNFNHRTGARGADLTCFHAIDLLAAAALDLNRPDYAALAERIAKPFIDLQSSRTGLIPFLHPDYPDCARGMRIPVGITWLDSLIDFGVSLVRLSAVTGDPRYHAAAERLAAGVIVHHKLAHGWASAVRVDDGALVNPTYSLKMTALVAKLFVALETPQATRNQDTLEGLLLQDR